VQVGLVPVLAGPADGAAPVGVALVLGWVATNDGRARRVSARYQPQRGLQIIGQSGDPRGTDGPLRSGAIASFPQLPATDELVIQLRVAMEAVEGWMIIPVPQA
jgi:hypothetical protein